MLFQIAAVTGVTLEQAGRYLTYLSTFSTSFAAYFLLRSLNQNWIGVLVGTGLCLSGPIYSRTSVGMIDTDLFNLFFVLMVLGAITLSARAKGWRETLLWITFAGILNHLFFLFYSNAGFTIGFLLSLTGTYLAYRKPSFQFLAGLVVFIVSSGVAATLTAWQRLESFLNVYVLRTDSDSLLEASGASTEVFTSAIFGTISEIQKFSVAVATNDFGSPFFFGAGLAGLILWLMAGWQRLFSVIALFPFVGLYLSAGQRFGYYAAPLVLLGLFHLFAQVIKPIEETIRAAVRKRESQQPNETEPSKARGIKIRWIAIASGLAILSLAWLGRAFYPVGVTPPPTIKAYEIKPLLQVTQNYRGEKPIVTSWWDYGFELRYQTGAQGVTDGANPADVRNIYLARALISQSPLYAADEIRFAAYFSPEDLVESYPKRPPLELAKYISKDILLFLPSDLQYKMFPVYQIAAKTISAEALASYNAETSVFFVLYHRRPATYGEFELVYAQDGGAVVYRLRAPVLPKVKHTPNR